MSYSSPYKNIKEAFEARFTVNENGCWLWTGCCDKKGYGIFTYRPDGVVHQRAPRVAFHLYKGKRLGWLESACHTCDTPGCVNPEHLFCGTHRQNMLDKVRKGRHARGESNRHAKLTESKVRAIRADGRLQREIAEQYGITPSMVSTIKSRKNWAHI